MAAKKIEEEVETPVQKEKTVRIRLPLMKDKKGNSDVFVSVNERTWLIKRGVEVEIPECAAEVLRNQELMEETAMMFEEENQK